MGHRYKPGQSGNPGGRTKAHRELARYIRDKTLGGKELADICLTIARDDDADARVRLHAIEWLGDRGIGKPVQAVDLQFSSDVQVAAAPIDWPHVPLERRIEILRMLDEIGAITAGGPAADDEFTEH